VDGVYEVADDGARTYKPRDEEEMQQLTTLVQSAIGFNAERGDVVEVINMQFAGAETPLSEADEGSMFDFDKNDFMRIGEIVVLGILGILVLLLVIRPLLTRLFEPQPPPSAKPAVAGPPDAAQIQAPAEVDEDSMIDLQQVEGRVKASTIKKIGDLVDKHPDETVSIIRNWMYEAK
jgi:flagellar M-ring protein FliF